MCHLAQVRTIVFDKTGTLTHGKPLVTRVVKFVSEEVCPRWLFLALMQSAEQSSEHPLGAAITKHAKAYLGGLAVGVTDTFEVFPGQGLCAVVKHLEPLMAEQITVSKDVVHTRECVSSDVSFTERLTGSGGGAEESAKLTPVGHFECLEPIHPLPRCALSSTGKARATRVYDPFRGGAVCGTQASPCQGQQ